MCRNHKQVFTSVNKSFRILLLIIITTLTNCSKEEMTLNQEQLTGTWISLDKSDTLYFTNKNDFYKSNGIMVYEHYDYHLFQDSIEIGYNGKLFILDAPNTHKYFVKYDILTMDFTHKNCFGFKNELLTYEKVNGVIPANVPGLLAEARDPGQDSALTHRDYSLKLVIPDKTQL
jgi:hypothetical protein